MNISDRILGTAADLKNKGADGPFAFRMPVAVAQQLLEEMGVTHVPKGKVFDFHGHKIVAEDRIEVLRIDETEPQAANDE